MTQNKLLEILYPYIPAKAIGQYLGLTTVLWLGVCYFALQTFQSLDKFYRQNNSTKPLLYAGGGVLNENQNATRI